jgi:thioredoxin reductase (NADPH)
MSGTPEPKVRPVILAVDDEREDLELVERELRKRYEADYGVACEGSAEAGLERLRYFEASEQDVAVVLAALRKPGMSAVGFLVRVHDAFPLAKRLLLLDPMDRESRALLPRAMALGLIDYFEFKPGVPLNERFHRVVTDLLEEWVRPYHSEAHALVRVVGEGWSRRSHETRELLERYGVPYAFYAAGSQEGRDLLEQRGHGDERIPVVALPGGRVLVDPQDKEIAEAFVPADEHPSRQTVDVVVIGGGPAGLSAGVYSASEGLSTAIVERAAVWAARRARAPLSATTWGSLAASAARGWPTRPSSRRPCSVRASASCAPPPLCTARARNWWLPSPTEPRWRAGRSSLPRGPPTGAWASRSSRP